jgi:hypothetical protein
MIDRPGGVIGGQQFQPVGEWLPLPDQDSGHISTGIVGKVVSAPAFDGCFLNSYAYTDAPMRTGPPDSGAYSVLKVPPFTSWAVKMRVQRFGIIGRISDGNIFVGLTRVLTSDINQWDYCLNVSTPPRIVRGFPHPGNSVLIYERGTDAQFPPQPVFWRHGIWTSTDQVICFECINQTVRYVVDDVVVYTSTSIPNYGDPISIAVLFDCNAQELLDVSISSGSNVLIRNEVAMGPSVGADCEGLFPVPGASTIPLGLTRIGAAMNQMPSLPQGSADPIPVQFRETTMQWGEFQQQFGTGIKAANTLQQRPIRRFEIEWDGLSPEQAGILDAHYERTHSGIPFSIRHVHTGEVVTGCRYASYSRGDQVRYWVQSRSAVIVRYA